MTKQLHFGIVSEPVPGHLNRLLTLGRVLRNRGHRVTIFGIADLEAKITRENLGFCAVGLSDFPKGAWEKDWLATIQKHGIDEMIATIRQHTREAEMLCRDVPVKVRELGIDTLLIDQLQMPARYIAETTGRPYVTVCCGPGLQRNSDYSFPPPFVPWEFSKSIFRRILNRIGFWIIEKVASPRIKVSSKYAVRDGLKPYRKVDDVLSPFLQVSHLTPEMNFSLQESEASSVRYFGPLLDEQRAKTDFPWEKLNGKPLIYASLGTLQTYRDDLFEMIARACESLNVQLVITLGDWQNKRELPKLPGDPLVVGYAPQLEMLEKAALCITHCGMNTTMECAAKGVPMIGIPIIHDQPAVAARIRFAKMGETVSLSKISVDLLREKISKVLGNSEYSDRAKEVASACAKYGGSQAAAVEIEKIAHKFIESGVNPYGR